MKSVMDFTDERKRRIVFVSQCILNQNVRFPGIAVCAGVCTELVDRLVKNDFGIEAMPCLERLGWGGVSRKTYFRYQSIFLAWKDTPLFFIFTFLGRLWLFRYSLLCKREAEKIVAHIRDYIDSGYSVSGIILMNDSPTDGATKTIDLIRAVERITSLGYDPAVMKNPKLDVMRKVIPLLCEKGEGIFTRRLIRELSKRNVDSAIIDYDPWTDQDAESKRVIGELENTSPVLPE